RNESNVTRDDLPLTVLTNIVNTVPHPLVVNVPATCQLLGLKVEDVVRLTQVHVGLDIAAEGLVQVNEVREHTGNTKRLRIDRGLWVLNSLSAEDRAEVCAVPLQVLDDAIQVDELCDLLAGAGRLRSILHLEEESVDIST